MVPIFIFSMPRSGSTLLQRILASHPDIETANEPHILLPLIYSLRETGVYSEYHHEQVARAIQDFSANFPNAVDDYFGEIRDFVLKLYQKASKKKAVYFVDKTPNYFLIAEEIINLFPEAKILFLWRNPLAIVSSLMTTWHGGRWNLYQHDVHLYDSPDKLAALSKKFRNKYPNINYEKLLSNPENELRRIFKYLRLDYHTEVLTNFSKIQLGGRMGDQPGINKYQSLNFKPLTNWHDYLSNPIRKTWCRRYLNWLGDARLEMMGYQKEELLSELNRIPTRTRFFASDLFWMPYGVGYRLFEGRLLKNNLQSLMQGKRLRIHR